MPILSKTGHEQQIGDKFTKYTKNDAFGFFNGHYFFIDRLHEHAQFAVVYISGTE